MRRRLRFYALRYLRAAARIFWYFLSRKVKFFIFLAFDGGDIAWGFIFY